MRNLHPLLLGLAAIVLAPAPAHADPEPAYQPVWARCWVDGGALACARPEEGSSGVVTKVMIDVTDREGRDLGGPMLEPDGTVQTTAIRAGAYPLTVRVSAMFAWSSEMATGAAPAAMTATYTVAKAKTYTSAAPLVVQQPFALWRVGVTARGSTVLLQATAPALSIAPFAIGYPGDPAGATTIEPGGVIAVHDGDTVRRWVVAPPGGTLAATVSFYDVRTGAHEDVAVTLSGPTELVAEDGVVTPAK